MPRFMETKQLEFYAFFIIEKQRRPGDSEGNKNRKTMKKIVLFAMTLALSFGMFAQSDNYVDLEDFEVSGYEMQNALSDDGATLVQKAYKWYAGIGVADSKQMAIELAQREAYATISRVFDNMVNDKCTRANVDVNGKVYQAVRSCWMQVSQTLSKGCEPFGKAKIRYNSETKMYEVTAKVAILGPRFKKMMGEVAEEKPKGLTKEELDEFVEINQAIIEAASEQ